MTVLYLQMEIILKLVIKKNSVSLSRLIPYSKQIKVLVIISVIVEYIIVHIVLVKQYKNGHFSNCKCSHFVNINSQKENKSGQIIT